MVKSTEEMLKSLAKQGDATMLFYTDHAEIWCNDKMVKSSSEVAELACWMEVRIRMGIPFDAERKPVKRGWK